MKNIMRIHETLLAAYGHQGWWPLLSHKGTNPTKTGSTTGYHPGDYSFPHNDAERFEICCGAILTQNTAWTNVEKALQQLAGIKALTPEKIAAMEHERLAALIRPAGYYNQKARKLK
jgi:endonuclease-3 related protein